MGKYIMLELVKQIKEYTEAGIILNHMHLFDRLEDYFSPVMAKGKPTEEDIEAFNKSEQGIIESAFSWFLKDGDKYTIEGVTHANGELKVFTHVMKESCTNCIYWMEDMELCSNSVVTNIYSDVEVKDSWCELWRSEDEVISEKDNE